MKRKRQRALLRVIDLVLVLVLVGAIILGAIRAQKLWQHLSSARRALGQVASTLAGDQTALIQLLQDPDQLDTLQNTLTTLDADLTALQDLARPFLPLAPHLGWLPGIGGDVQAAPQLLDMARQTSDAAQVLIEGLMPLAGSFRQSESGIDHLGPEIVHGLAQAQSQFKAAQSALTRAAESRAMVEADRLSPETQALVDRFDQYQPILENGLKALTALPELLGADGPHTYLLLAQNNHELRATGGFISGVGLVQIDGGQIITLHFQDSYTVDNLAQPHPLPPEPLRRHMGAGMLVLRDANWWPDFPTSAQAVAALYLQDQGQAVDGVIAVDLTTLHYLVQALGPTQMPGYDQTVSKENLQTLLMSFWEAPLLARPGKEDVDWWQHRKDFAADLLSTLLTNLQEQATPDDLRALTEVVGRALRERHLIVYVKEMRVQAILHEMDWDGALRSTDGDYLMIVDSNVGFNKVNPNIEQTVDYQATVNESGEITVRLILSYRHRFERPTPACVHESRYGDSYADLLERCYWDYLRIYVPLGSELLELDGADAPAEVYQESGKTVIATSFLLETGQARQIQVLYRPNLRVLAEQYSLLVQKQPGTAKLPLRISLRLPPGVQPVAASPEGLVWLDDQFVWQGDLAQDREFEFSWQESP